MEHLRVIQYEHLQHLFSGVIKRKNSIQAFRCEIINSSRRQHPKYTVIPVYLKDVWKPKVANIFCVCIMYEQSKSEQIKSFIFMFKFSPYNNTDYY